MCSIVAIYEKQERVAEYHAKMFHGMAFRPSLEDFGLDQIHQEGTPQYHLPLQVVREGSAIPDIFCPQGIAYDQGLIVAEKVKQQLEEVPNISFGAVNFVRLFEREWEVGNFDFVSDPLWNKYLELRYKDEHWFLMQHPDDWDLRLDNDRFFEVLVPNASQIENRYPDAELIRSTPVFGNLSERMVQENPLIEAGGCLMTEDVFKRIEAFFDWDFFTLCRFETDFKTKFGDSLKVKVIERY